MTCVINSNPRFFIAVLSQLAPAHLDTRSNIVPQRKSLLVTREVLHIFLKAARIDHGSQATPPQTIDRGTRALV